MKTVLLAYERDQDLAAVESVLQARGHRVLKARSGVEALELVRNQTPDAIVSDVLLPRMDGFALCRRLREDPAYLHLPFMLHSFRVEGPKYEAFAAEVGAQRFFPRGSTLEELATVLDEAPQGSGTMRMPALVPELLDRREQDRRRLFDLERQLKEAEAGNRALAASNVSRASGPNTRPGRGPSLPRPSRSASANCRCASASWRRRSGRPPKPNRRRAAWPKRRRPGPPGLPCSKHGSTNCRPRGHARSRAPTMPNARLRRSRRPRGSSTWNRGWCTRPRILPPRWSGWSPRRCAASRCRNCCRARSLPTTSAREAVVHWRREDGSESRLELQRIATSYAGRASWLLTARDVTSEFAAHAREQELATQAEALDAAPEACGIVDGEGRLRYGNRALLALLGVDR